jgi:hypothetical protein
MEKVIDHIIQYRDGGSHDVHYTDGTTVFVNGSRNATYRQPQLCMRYMADIVDGKRVEILDEDRKNSIRNAVNDFNLKRIQNDTNSRS